MLVAQKGHCNGHSAPAGRHEKSLNHGRVALPRDRLVRSGATFSTRKYFPINSHGVFISLEGWRILAGGNTPGNRPFALRPERSPEIAVDRPIRPISPIRPIQLHPKSPLSPARYRPISGPKIKGFNQTQTVTDQKILPLPATHDGHTREPFPLLSSVRNFGHSVHGNCNLFQRTYSYLPLFTPIPALLPPPGYVWSPPIACPQGLAIFHHPSSFAIFRQPLPAYLPPLFLFSTVASFH